jgi:hypothetical protein
MKIPLPKAIVDGLSIKAREANISPESAAILILREFVRGHGSCIYVGKWRRGDAEGKRGHRYVIDWPFQPGFVKLSGNQSIDLTEMEE